MMLEVQSTKEDLRLETKLRLVPLQGSPGRDRKPAEIAKDVSGQ
jgi:hypothetical protein